MYVGTAPWVKMNDNMVPELMIEKTKNKTIDAALFYSVQSESVPSK